MRLSIKALISKLIFIRGVAPKTPLAPDSYRDVLIQKSKQMRQSDLSDKNQSASWRMLRSKNLSFAG
jgi:hypothetical protein